MKDHLTGEANTDTLTKCASEESKGSWGNKELVSVEIEGGYVVTTQNVNGRLMKTRVPATQEQASKGNAVKFAIKGKDIKPAQKLPPTKTVPYLVEVKGEECAVPYSEYQAMCHAVAQYCGKNASTLNFFQRKEIKSFVGRVLEDNQKYHTAKAFESLLIEYSKTLKNGWGFYLGQLDSWFGQKKEGRNADSGYTYEVGPDGQRRTNIDTDIDLVGMLGLT